MPQSLTKVNREEGRREECSVSMATLRAVDNGALGYVSVTSGGRKGSLEKPREEGRLHHAPGWGVGDCSGTWCGPGGGEEKRQELGPLGGKRQISQRQISQRAGDTHSYGAVTHPHTQS